MYALQLLLVVQVLSDIERHDNGFKAEFSVINKGRLYFTFIHYRKLDFGECLFKCISFLNCITFNYHSESKTCELTDEDFDWHEADVDTPGWYNYGTPPKVDGGFTEWRSSAPCSATCGYEGKQIQIRECTNPKPKNGGAECVGEKTRYGPCRDVKPCLIIACENSLLEVSCPDGKKIKIVSASYGRSDNTTCPYGSLDVYPNAMKRTNCHAAKSNTVMTTLCKDRTSCSIVANSLNFGGDPCGGTYKYLLVQYECY